MSEIATIPESTIRRGKIGRLPARVRQALNERLHDGEQGPTILPWINGLAEVRAILDRDFSGAEVSPQNLSEWRQGGFLDWQRDQARVGHIRKLAELSFQLAKAAGGNMAEGALAVAGGKILEVLEGATEDNIVDLSQSVSALRGAELKHTVVELARRTEDRKQGEFELTKLKFRRQTAELFIEYFLDRRAREVMDSGVTGETRLNQIAELMFGANPFQTAGA